jgi:hypothetical protein
LLGTAAVSIRLSGVRRSRLLSAPLHGFLADYALTIGLTLAALLANTYFANIPRKP